MLRPVHERDDRDPLTGRLKLRAAIARVAFSCPPTPNSTLELQIGRAECEAVAVRELRVSRRGTPFSHVPLRLLRSSMA